MRLGLVVTTRRDDCQKPPRCLAVARVHTSSGLYTWHRWRNRPWRTHTLSLSRLVQNRYLRLDRRRLSHFPRRRPLLPHSRPENSLAVFRLEISLLRKRGPSPTSPTTRCNGRRLRATNGNATIFGRPVSVASYLASPRSREVSYCCLARTARRSGAFGRAPKMTEAPSRTLVAHPSRARPGGGKEKEGKKKKKKKTKEKMIYRWTRLSEGSEHAGSLVDRHSHTHMHAHGHTYRLRATAATKNAKSAAAGVGPTTHNRDGYRDVVRRRRRRPSKRAASDARGTGFPPRDWSSHTTPARLLDQRRNLHASFTLHRRERTLI